MPRAREAPDVADHGGQRDGGHDVDAWDRHQPPHVLVAEHLLSDDRVDLGQLVAEEVQLAQAGVDRQALVEWQLLRGDPRAALLAERVAGRVASLQVAMQHRADLVLDLGAALDQPATARHQPAQHPHALVADPHRRDQVGGQQIGEHLGVDLVGLIRAWLIARTCLACASTTSATCGSRILAIARRVAGRLQHHPVRRPQALREQRKLLGRRGDPSGRARPASVGDRDLTEVAMHVQPDRPAHHQPPSSTTQRGSSAGKNDTYGFALAAHPGKSQGRPVTPAGSRPIRVSACPTAFSQSPCPGTPRTYDPARTSPETPAPFSCRYTTSWNLTAPVEPDATT